MTKGETHRTRTHDRGDATEGLGENATLSRFSVNLGPAIKFWRGEIYAHVDWPGDATRSIIMHDVARLSATSPRELSPFSHERVHADKKPRPSQPGFGSDEDPNA